MTENGGDGESRPESTSGVRLPRWAAGAVAVCVLVGYGFFTYKMLGLTTNDGVVWERALLIYRSVEALAFAAAGVVLGVQIQRGQVQAAETELTNANAKFERKARAAKELVSNTSSGAAGQGGVEVADPKGALKNQATTLRNLKTAIDAIL